MHTTHRAPAAKSSAVRNAPAAYRSTRFPTRKDAGNAESSAPHPKILLWQARGNKTAIELFRHFCAGIADFGIELTGMLKRTLKKKTGFRRYANEN